MRARAWMATAAALLLAIAVSGHAQTQGDPVTFVADALVRWQYSYQDVNGNALDPAAFHFVVHVRRDDDLTEHYTQATADGGTLELLLSAVHPTLAVGGWHVWVSAVNALGESASTVVWIERVAPPAGKPATPTGLTVVEIVP